MDDSRGQGPFGAVLFPTQDTVAPQGSDRRTNPGQLTPLPRRRRPMMIVVAALLVGLGVLISVAMYQRADRQVQVLVVQRVVPAGSQINATDLGTASIAASGISDIPALERSRVVGLVAASALHPGMLLAASDLVTSLPPPPGKVLVGVSVRPSAVLASGLVSGDRITLIATPGVIGEDTQGGAPNLSMLLPVSGVVEAVDDTPDQDGDVVVDVVVPAAEGGEVLQQDSTGQIGLIVTKQVPQ